MKYEASVNAFPCCWIIVGVMVMQMLPRGRAAAGINDVSIPPFSRPVFSANLLMKERLFDCVCVCVPLLPIRIVHTCD